MSILWQVVYLLLWFFRLLLLGRLIMEIVRSFARGWRPSGRSAVAMELLYSATDPALKPLRRALPQVRLGGIALDISLLILLVVVNILMTVALRLVT